MAAENLNRAFIRAYDKGKSKGKPTQSQPIVTPDRPVQESESNYIIQFDTATMSIPAPHMLSARKDTSEFAHVAPAPPVASQPVRQSLIEQNVVPERAEVSVAETEGDTFDKDYWNNERLTDLFGGATLVAPMSQAGPKPNTAHSVRASLSTPNEELPDLQAPKGPALAGTEPTPELAERISQRSKDGDIFRLDRPSYSGPAVTSEPYEESSDESSMLDASNYTNVDVSKDFADERAQPGHSVRGPSRSFVYGKTTQQDSEMARSVEEGLRQARVRIFNPLWEVDRLQWPEVCTELLQTLNENMQGVAQNLMHACHEGLQVLAVTSPQSGEGTSTVACCLAMLAGSHGMNIALVDGNMENPSLSHQTNLDVEFDWQQAIAQQMPLEEIAVHSLDDQVTLVPLLERLSADSVSDHSMASMLQELSQSFDLVIVDMGHMNSPYSMVRALGEQGVLNAVVAVVDHRSSTPERIESCLRRIRQTGVASIGLVENFAA